VFIVATPNWYYSTNLKDDESGHYQNFYLSTDYCCSIVLFQTNSEKTICILLQS